MSADDRTARVDAEIVAPLRAATPAVDELGRARLVSAIDAALDREDRDRAARRGAAPGGRARRRWVMVALGAAAAVTLAIGLRAGGRRTQTPPPPAVVSAVPPVAAPPSLLRPVEAPDRAAPAALGPTTSLVAARGERARATIGTRVRLTLVGAGRVSVLAPARAGDIELALDGGRLLIDYDGRPGGTLRVRSPGALTTVVGTLFAVEAVGSGSRVAVVHGEVRTEDLSGGGAQVAAGSSWTTAEGRAAAIPDELAAALAEHEAGWHEAGSIDRSTAPPPPAAAADRDPVRPVAVRRRPRADLDALYARAEAAMRERALGEARRALETIAARDPRGPLGEAALLDLARLALGEGDRAEARRALSRLGTPLRDPALAETAAHLRCRAESKACGAN